MCGRFVLEASREAVEALFEVEVTVLHEARFNIAPSQPVLHVHAFLGERQTDFARWGLVPHWHKDPANAQMLINARIETVLEKPSFRTAVRHRRVLVPATHFYEWRREGKVKQPYAANRKNPDGSEGLFAFAGIIDEPSGADGSTVPTLAILTQQADGALLDIHHRAPVVVPAEHYASWLDCRTVSPETALEPLRTPPPDAWMLWPVDRAVNRAGVDGARLLEEIPLPEGSTAEEEDAPKQAQLDLF
ncbi:MAG: SOS response-associated peptidase [Devosiaceae bacterium]|nr:SOS response-associated peptidase [Devosiaceae bacterium MH13]